MNFKYRIGIDENGLGARMGPMVVTGVLVELTSDAGERTLKRKLPKAIRCDLDDSKRLVSHGSIGLGEAWVRALLPTTLTTPRDLFEHLSLEGSEHLKSYCPESSRPQCWTTDHERFEADDSLVARVKGHLSALERRGVRVMSVKSSVLCAKSLNDALTKGINRFSADLHAMERLTLHFRQQTPSEVLAICGKVGGMADYEQFFGPLAARLRVRLEKQQRHSAYRFPGLGNLHFIQDADAKDPLVMLASLVGKWVRELLMARVAAYYLPDEPSEKWPSGYHDAVSARFFAHTEPVRVKRRIPLSCFERGSENRPLGAGLTCRAPVQ